MRLFLFEQPDKYFIIERTRSRREKKKKETNEKRKAKEGKRMKMKNWKYVWVVWDELAYSNIR